MNADRISIWDRLEFRASERRQTSTMLNLYRNQQNSLRKEGLTVEEISPVADYPGQYLCNIDWSAPSKTHCFAHRLLTLAATKNDSDLGADDEGTSCTPRPYEV